MSTDVLIAGDVFPAALHGESLAARLGQDAAPDLFVWTLDAAIAAGPRRDGVTCLSFEPDALDCLRLGKTNVAVTASNHLTDFGDAGAVATLDELDQRGFQHVGAGANRAAAARNLYVDLPAGRVALLAFAEIHPRVSALEAGETNAGVRPVEVEICLRAIREAAQQADWVWVVLHWGEEFVRFPDPQHREIAHQMVDAGAALVAASHTHVPLGYERRGAATIFYGLGNFLFPPFQEAQGYTYQWHPAARQGVVAAGRFADGAWSWEPREIRISPAGFPRLGHHGWCPDYGTILPRDAAEYARVFPRLRRGERIKFRLQRLCFMSWQERAFRIRKLMGAGPNR